MGFLMQNYMLAFRSGITEIVEKASKYALYLLLAT